LTSLERIINEKTNDERGAAAYTPPTSSHSPTKTVEKLEAIDGHNSKFIAC
jgi:hypothetical protein